MKLILSDQTAVGVEISSGSEAFETQGLSLAGKKVDFSDAIKSGGTVLKDAISSLREELKSALPKNLEIEIGLKISAEGSIIIAKGTSEAAITIKATW